MERLSGIEAVSLHSETSTTPAHSVAVIVMDASDRVSHERLHALVGSVLPQLARFRGRLINKPLGMGQPVWADIDDYQPARQIRRIAVPAPGGREEFEDLIAKLITRPLDRHLPLWQAWSIEGLRDGGWALALKMSQATTGGIAGVGSVISQLLTAEPDDEPVGVFEPGAGKPPSIAGLVADAAREIAGNQLAAAQRLTDTFPGVVAAAVERVRARRHELSRTSFNEPLTERRSVALASVPMTEVNTVKEVFGVGVTEVFFAACTLALRSWLSQQGAVPTRPLVLRTTLPHGDLPAVIRLPVQLDDPVEIFSKMCIESDTAAVQFVKSAELVAPSVLHAGSVLFNRLGMSRRLPPLAHGFGAHIFGPSGPVFCAGGEVVGLHVLPPLTEGAGLTITTVSHAEVLDVGVCVCPDRVSGVRAIADGIVDAVGRLLVMRKKSRPKDRH
jgi:diacylglycerol O-acyltransferase / wax synthase